MSAAEYLFKLGLPALASACGLEGIINTEGKGFSDVLCVSKQYLPLYQKHDVTPAEHDIIKASNKWISEDVFLKYRNLAPQSSDWHTISQLLKEMSLERFVNYFTRQKAMYAKTVSLYAVLTIYRDYINMSMDMGVDLSRKAVRFPKDSKEAHDQILERFNEIKAEKTRNKVKAEDAVFRRAVKKIYDEKGISPYTDGTFCIVLPMGKSDFVIEGQSLRHCVGGSYYSDAHKEGTRMIFFVRNADKPTKPFFTVEIDMISYSIRQLRGLGNCDPSPDVKQFVNAFLKHIKPNRRKSA